MKHKKDKTKFNLIEGHSKNQTKEFIELYNQGYNKNEIRKKLHIGHFAYKKYFKDNELTILVNLLNKLHQEIEYWKEKHLQEVERNSTISATIDNHNNWHDNKCVFLKQIKELQKENQQLKQQNQRWEKICCEGLRINDRLRKKIIKNEDKKREA